MSTLGADTRVFFRWVPPWVPVSQMSFMLGRDLAKRGFETEALDYLSSAAAPWNRQARQAFSVERSNGRD